MKCVAVTVVGVGCWWDIVVPPGRTEFVEHLRAHLKELRVGWSISVNGCHGEQEKFEEIGMTLASTWIILRRDDFMMGRASS